MADEPEILLEGTLGTVRAEDVLQLVAQGGWAARIVFESHDRVTGDPWAVELCVREGRVAAIGPRGSGLRLGDLAVAHGLVARRDVEAAAAAGPWLGARLVERGHLEAADLEDLLWERCARVVWSLLAWEHGRFRVESYSGSEAAGTGAPGPEPAPIAGILLDGLQRAESALAALEGATQGPDVSQAWSDRRAATAPLDWTPDSIPPPEARTS